MAMSMDKSSLKALAIRGSIWTLAGHGGVLLIRMGRSLIMTRLLFPEVYGLMTLVWAVLTGLQMFADTGIVPTIIRDERGDDPSFLNTAFTTNVLRGLLLWVISCVIAHPMAAIYHQPALDLILPVTGLTALIHGFVSTAMYTRRRHMDFKRLAILDLSNETIHVCRAADVRIFLSKRLGDGGRRGIRPGFSGGSQPRISPRHPQQIPLGSVGAGHIHGLRKVDLLEQRGLLSLDSK